MTAAVEQRLTSAPLAERSLAGRAWSALAAAWGGFVGLLPHVLHHVGPLAGAALLAGSTGRALFAALGFVAAIPLLLRLRSRFGSWRAPALALVLFGVMFAVSSFVVGPAISGDDAPARPGLQVDRHAEHH